MGHRSGLLIDVSIDYYRKEHMLHDSQRVGDDREPHRRSIPERTAAGRPPPANLGGPHGPAAGGEGEDEGGSRPGEARVLPPPAGRGEDLDERVLRRPRIILLP